MEQYVRKAKRDFFYSYNMIFDQPISAHTKTVYIYLCRCADADGQAFPSVRYIANKCSVSESSVHRALRVLNDMGLILKEPQFSINTHGVKFQTSNLYTIFDAPNHGNCHPDIGGGEISSKIAGSKSADCHTDTPRVSPRHPPGVTATPPGCHGDTLSNTSLSNTRRRRGGASPQSPPLDENTSYGELGNVKLSAAQFNELCAVYSEPTVKDYINRIDIHIDATGKKYRSHASLIKKWITEDKRKDSSKNKSKPTRFANFQQRDNSQSNADYELLSRQYILDELANIDDDE